MVRWDDSTRLMLCQVILEQAPNFKVDFQAVCDSWPGAEGPTIRACKDQWSLLKKGTSKTSKSSPRTPGRSTGHNTPRKQASNVTPTLAIRSKRGNADTPETTSSSKKRKTLHEEDVTEIVQEVQTSVDEGELSSEETEESISDDNSRTPTSVVRRQPLRSRARSKTIVEDSFSSDDDGAKAEDADIDSDFDLEKDYESKLSPAAKLQRKRDQKQTQARQAAPKAQSSAVKEDMDDRDASSMIANLGDYGDASDEDRIDQDEVSSQATKRTSWQTAVSQFDDVEEI